MRHGFRRTAVLFLAAAVGGAAAEENPLADFLNRRGYDRDAILQQFPEDAPPPPVSPPQNDAGSGGDAKPDGAASGQDSDIGFIPLQQRPAVASARQIALVLPTLADGLAGHAAENVYQGCLHGIRAAGRTAEIKLYAGGGGAAETVQNYQAAVNQGAHAVVGPLLKTNVRELVSQYAETPAPTLLLQPAAGKGYYAMSLDAAREADDLARLLRRRGMEAALVAEQNTPGGARQRAAFETRWLAEGGSLPGRIQIRNEETDWNRLFQMLKEREDTAAVFAAGDADFAAKARNFSPQKHPVFAASVFQAPGRAASALSVENLRFMEMPWFAGLDETRAPLDSPAARVLPAVRQRFFVLGADACRAAHDSPRWRAGWLMRGLAGDWELQADGIFARAGVLAAYRGGQLRAEP